jgi:hypothetical protein
LPTESYHPWPETLAQLLDHLVRKCGEEQANLYSPLLREAAEAIGIENDDEYLHPDEVRTLLRVVRLPTTIFGIDDEND